MNDVGSNHPPVSLAAVLASEKADELMAAFDKWMASTVGPESAAALVDFDAQLFAVIEEFDATREAERKPHREAADAVQAAWKPTIDRLTSARPALRALLVPYFVKHGPVRGAISGKLATARMRRYPLVRDFTAAVYHYLGSPDGTLALAEFLQKLAGAEIRAGATEIPGFEIKEEWT